MKLSLKFYAIAKQTPCGCYLIKRQTASLVFNYAALTSKLPPNLPLS